MENWLSPISSKRVPGLRELMKATRDDVLDHEPGARATLQALLTSESESIRLQAARALMVAPPEADPDDSTKS